MCQELSDCEAPCVAGKVVIHMTTEKACVECAERFEVDASDLAFYDQISPTFLGQKFLIPPPTRCPDCRQQRRLALCNERFFYNARCGLCNNAVLTEHPPHSQKTVYCRECWHGDGWDPSSYGQEVDFSRPMFEQFKELWSRIPAQNLLSEGTNVNSEYIHYAGFAKNCYLIMHADFCEDCYYGYGFKRNISCVDGFYNLSCELCYDCIDVHSCYALRGSQDCVNCSSSAFLRDCIGCKSCFLCVGLRNKEYCFENLQLSRHEYEQRLAAIHLGSNREYQSFKARRGSLEKDHLFKEFHGHNVENCRGDYISNCKDTRESFDCEDVEHGRFLYQVVTGAKNDYDIYQYGLNLSEAYECSVAGNNCYHVLFCHNAHLNCSDLLYCWFVQSSKNCFGCFSMHHREYCVLNKQYSKSDYERLVARIIEHMQKTGEWGELFPISFSPFGYNKTNASLHYPMNRDDVIKKGWKWDDTGETFRTAESILEAANLPDSIDEVSDSILTAAIRCEVTGKLFRLVEPELRFYQSQSLPLPRRCPDQRHLDRFAKRNPRKFWKRPCAKCSRELETTYASERPEKVCCEECYRIAVY